MNVIITKVEAMPNKQIRITIKPKPPILEGGEDFNKLYIGEAKLTQLKDFPPNPGTLFKKK